MAKVEQDLVLTEPQLYVQGGCLNWALIHKHAVILEKECKGKLQKRKDIPELLKNTKGYKNLDSYSGKKYDSSSGLSAPPKFENPTAKTTAINHAKADLQRHGIVFSKHESPCMSSTSLYRCVPSNEEEEREELSMMLKQSVLDQQQFSYPVTAQPFLILQPKPKPVNASVADNTMCEENSINVVKDLGEQESADSNVNKDVDTAAKVLELSMLLILIQLFDVKYFSY